MSEAQDIFAQINNAVLDLQAADLQSYIRPLKRLGRLLQHSELKLYNDQLIAHVDLEAFLSAGEKTQQGTMGSTHLDWPDDDREVLGLQLLLILRFCDDPKYTALFGHKFYYSGNKIINDMRAVTGQIIVPFARDYKNYVLQQGDTSAQLIHICRIKSLLFMDVTVKHEKLSHTFSAALGLSRSYSMSRPIVAAR